MKARIGYKMVRMTSSGLAFLLVLFLGAASVQTACAQGNFGHEIVPTNRTGTKYDKKYLPATLQKVAFDQKLNEQIPLDLRFKDELGNDVSLSQYFNGRPVVLTMVYFGCPMLCTQVLNGLVGSMKALSFDVGKEYEAVTVSFDPKDTPELAFEKKQNYIRRLGQKSDANPGWHFLTGDSATIKKLTDAVGFHFVYDPISQQFAHASGIVVATPEGKVSKYLFGIEYAPKDLKFALMQATEEQIGTVVDEIFLYCYHYDPTTGRYGAVISNVLRIGGGITIAIILGLLLMLNRVTAARKNKLTAGDSI